MVLRRILRLNRSAHKNMKKKKKKKDNESLFKSKNIIEELTTVVFYALKLMEIQVSEIYRKPFCLVWSQMRQTKLQIKQRFLEENTII